MIEIAELRGYVGSPSSDDAVLTTLEAAAVAAVEQLAGRYFGPVTSRTEYVNGTGSRTLWLQERPVVAGDPPELTVSVHEWSGTSWEAVAPALFEVRDYQLVRIDGSSWAAKEYRVAYNAGYAANTEPAHVRLLVKAMVARAYRNRSGLRSETVASHSETFAYLSDLPGYEETEDMRWVSV